MTLVDEKERESYLACGAYGWKYSEEWSAQLRYIWDMTAKEHDRYEVLLYPLQGQFDHLTSPYALKQLWAGNIRCGDGLQDMINRAEQSIAKTLAAYAKGDVK